MKNIKKGFTLVELIVVITILAVLATIAFITLGDYPMKTRDTKRIAQVGTIFDKMKIISATEFKTFVKGKPSFGSSADTNQPSPAITGVSNVTSVEGEVDFVALGEEISKFTTYNGTDATSGDVYKVKAIKYTGANGNNHYCHVVGVKGELNPKITKSDCPKGLDVTL
ncbi:hypothetical protein DLH72_03890 [Candidatus Gracilibacteria bacterium]|nr:MAG: hypothetical protein DLH72_03890 [Candidatus Gracilibacteria bacterium]